MISVAFSVFPHGRRKAFTLSYDNGSVADRKLVDLMDLYSLRGTFNLNSGKFGVDGFVRANEVSVLYDNHEVAIHTVHHAHLEHIPASVVITEVMGDRKRLEGLVGYPVRGMAYPFGGYSDSVIETVEAVGIRYGRTLEASYQYTLPKNFMRWQPTCHHYDNILDRARMFVSQPVTHRGEPALFYLWGNSQEIEQDNMWDMVEEFFQEISHQPDVWYATNIDIVDYITALKRLEFSADNSLVYNPNVLPLWIEVNDQIREITPGAVTLLI